MDGFSGTLGRTWDLCFGSFFAFSRDRRPACKKGAPVPSRMSDSLPGGGGFGGYLKQPFCFSLCCRVMTATRGRVHEVAANDRDALDQLGDRLHQKDREAERYQKLGWIDRQPAGVEGLLVLLQRAPEELGRSVEDH